MPDPNVVVRPQLQPLQARVEGAVTKIQAKQGTPAPGSTPNTPAGADLAQKTAAEAAAKAKAALTPPLPGSETPKPPAEPPKGKDYIELAKTEARIQADRRILQAEKEAIAREREAAQKERQRIEDLRTRARTDPDSVARE